MKIPQKEGKGMEKVKKACLVRLPHGKDLTDALLEECDRKGIRSGFVSVIGAVKEATIGYYDQRAKEYRSRRLFQPLEITSCTGNISLKDQEVFLHLHILLSDSEGRTYGGHLLSPTPIFAAEAWLVELEGPPLERLFDEVTGLFLWR